MERFAEHASHYAEEEQVFSLFHELLTSLVKHQPADPIQHLIDVLDSPPPPCFFVLGPPGCGRRTQAEELCARLGLVHVCARDLLVSEVEAGSALGQRIRDHLGEHEHVSDELMVAVVMARLSEDDCRERGFVLDGCPVTVGQAQALQTQAVIPEHVIWLECDDATCLDRARVRGASAEDLQPLSARLAFFRHQAHLVEDAYASSLCRVDCRAGLSVAAVHERVMYFVDRPLVDTSPMRHNIVLLGPPGSGLSSIAKALVARYGVVHVDVRQVLRAQVAGQTALGLKAAPFVNDPVLPMDMCIEAAITRIGERDCKRFGWVLDGFPLDEYAAGQLEEALVIPTRVVLVDVPAAVAQGRLVDLAVDPVDGKTYKRSRLAADGVPDAVATRLVTRPQHTRDHIRARRDAFHADLGPLLGYYAPVLQSVDGSGPLQTVVELVEDVIDRPLPQGMPTKQSTLDAQQPPIPATESISMRSPRSPRRRRDVNLKAGGVVVTELSDTDDDGDDGATAEAAEAAATGAATATATATATAGKLDFGRVASPSALDLSLDEDETLANEGATVVLAAGEDTLRVCVVGPPGSGKTTQCQRLASEFGLVHVAPHALLAKEVERGTRLGLRAEQYTHAMRMPDDIVVEVIHNRIQAEDCREKGWILDGFPESVWMAQSLHRAGIACNRYLCLDASEATSRLRLTGRLVDPETGALYHETLVPPPADDAVRERLAEFEEDEELRITNRIAHYAEHAQGSHDFHSDLFFHVNAELDIPSVTKLCGIGLRTAPRNATPRVVGSLQDHGALRIAVVGPPCAGVTTQAAVLADKLRVGLVAPLMTLKEEALVGTELGKRAAPYLDAMQMPDDIALDAVLKRLADEDCQRGWVLDGFPYSRWTADLLAKADVRPHRLVVLSAPADVLQERATHADALTSIHYEALAQRWKDNEQGLTDYFAKILVPVSAQGPPGHVSDLVEQVLTRMEASTDARVLVLGPLGSGAAPVAQMLGKRHKLPVISPARTLAREMTAATPLGMRAATTATAIQPPDDVLVDALLMDLRMPECENGFVLEGFPNSLATLNAALDQHHFALDLVVVLDISDEEALERAVLHGESRNATEQSLDVFRTNIAAVLDYFASHRTHVERFQVTDFALTEDVVLAVDALLAQ